MPDQKKLLQELYKNIVSYAKLYKEQGGKDALTAEQKAFFETIKKDILPTTQKAIKTQGVSLVKREQGGPDAQVVALQQKVVDALEDWANISEDILDKQTSWLLANLMAFYLKTTSSPGISATADTVKKVVGGVLSAGTTELVKAGSKQLLKSATKAGIIATATATGAAIGAPAGGIGAVPGAVIGFVVGVIIDVVVNKIWDALTPNGEMLAIMKNNDKIEKYFNGASTQLDSNKEAEKKKIRAIVVLDKTAIRKVTDKVALQNTLDYIVATNNKLRTVKNNMNVGDRSLYKELLNAWVKENAGDDADDPNQYGAAQEQWDNAIDILQDDNKLPTGDGIVKQADVFAYQLRGELNRLGLKLDKANQLIKYVQNMVKARQAVDKIKTAYQMKKFYFSEKDLTNPTAFVDHVNLTCDIAGISAGMSAESEKWVKGHGNFGFTIACDLDIDEKSIFVDNFYYTIDLKDAPLEWYATTKENWSEGID